uniref:Type I-B CRISPR-associated protein Cas8b1/Cst1 n=1 Tax=Dictyoglomus thermophilum TaxID=14 RepID=A0A7C3RKY6_DICTH
MERVYLSDWLYNSGIVGFLTILFEGKSDLKKGDNYLPNGYSVYIGDNYIEFERDVLIGFSDKYFYHAYNRYGRLRNFIDSVKQALGLLNSENVKDIKKIYEDIKNRINNFDKLKKLLSQNNIEIPDFNKIKENVDVYENFLKDILSFIENNMNELMENDVKIYLSKIYGQKSFLNNVIKSNLKEKFKEDFEDKIIERRNKLDKNLLCINCKERKAKKDTFFDTGISPFTGINKDAVNFFWNFNAKLPLCEVCELIYFCTFAGFTESVRKPRSYLFVNYDISLIDLYKANLRLKEILNKNLSDNILIDFLSELLVEEEVQKSTYALESIAFIEVDLVKKDLLPKVYSLNINRKKAEYLKFHSDKEFKRIADAQYVFKSNKENIQRSVILEFLEKFIANSINYDYLVLLEYLYIEKLRGNNNIFIYFNPRDIQDINQLVYDYNLKFNKNGGDISMTSKGEESLWFMFQKGKELAQKLISEKAENKIPSIAYKLLSSLRIEDVNSFMNLVLRLYLSYNLEVPTLFVKALNDKNSFLAYGYGFLNGILDEYNKKVNEGGQ